MLHFLVDQVFPLNVNYLQIPHTNMPCLKLMSDTNYEQYLICVYFLFDGSCAVNSCFTQLTRTIMKLSLVSSQARNAP